MKKTLGDIADELLKAGYLINSDYSWVYHGLTEEEKLNSIYSGIEQLLKYIIGDKDA